MIFLVSMVEIAYFYPGLSSAPVMSHVKILPKGIWNLMLNSYHEQRQEHLTQDGQRRPDYAERIFEDYQ